MDIDCNDLNGGEVTPGGSGVKRPSIDLYVHVEKGGAHKELDFNKSHALVRLSGYMARWPQNQQNQQTEAKNVPCDENCLPRKFFFALEQAWRVNESAKYG